MTTVETALGPIATTEPALRVQRAIQVRSFQPLQIS